MRSKLDFRMPQAARASSPSSAGFLSGRWFAPARKPGRFFAGDYFAAARSASEVNESAKNWSSGSPHWATKSRLAESTTTGAPQT